MTPKQRFVILCQHFLYNLNPRLDREIIHLDCILAVPDDLVSEVSSLRELAHAFVIGTICSSKDDKAYGIGTKLEKWLIQWWRNFGYINREQD